LKRTTDAEAIRAVFTRPEIFPHVVADGDPQTWQPPIGDALHWLTDEGAAFLVYPSSGALWEMHAAVVPRHRDKTQQYVLAVFDYLREQTPCRHVIAVITETNEPAIARALRVGMKQEGYFPDSRIEGGRLLGAVVYGKGI
jgi:hypothetical protein